MRYKDYRELLEPHRYVFKTIPCPQCGKSTEIEVQAVDLRRYNQGAHIQEAFPYLSAADRERLLSGICGDCFDTLFLYTEEDLDDD